MIPFVLLCIAPLLAIGADATSRLKDRDIAVATESIRIDDLKPHIATLASDTLQGREGGSAGGQAASAYLIQQLRQRGFSAASEGLVVQEFPGGMRNVLAVVPGSDVRLRDEVVIVCAHFDHVGFGTKRNSRGPIGYIHNGADDNASGVASLLEVIEAVRTLPHPPRRTLLFAFWDGEEKGLLGSKHWLSSPTRPLKQIQLVINSDMIGRLRPEGVELTGARAARGMRQLVSEANSAEFAHRDWEPRPSGSGLLNPLPDGRGSTSNAMNSIAPRLLLDFTWDMRADSDHHPFFAAGIPALMLHTGKHDDYHRPSDDADKLNYEGIQRLTRLILLLALQAAEVDELPAFRAESRAETKDQQRLIEQPPPAPAPRLGITFDSKLAEQRIVEITEIAPQSAAAAAGLRVGDRLLRFGGYTVSDVADFRTLVVIADREVTAIVQRSGRSEPLELSVRLNGEPSRLGLSWRTDDAEPNSVIVTQVIPYSPAALAGLKPLDRIRRFGEHSANSRQFRETPPALPITATIERDGVLSTLSIVPINTTNVAAQRDAADINERP
ncbi:MAG: M28 family peptidase [Planctomycetaceae bacterium]